MASSEHRRLLRILRAVFATTFLLFASATYYLWRQYGSTRPGLLDQGSGQVHALYTMGWTVYLTRADQFRLYGLGLAAAACLVGAVALDTFALGKEERD